MKETLHNATIRFPEIIHAAFIEYLCQDPYTNIEWCNMNKVSIFRLILASFVIFHLLGVQVNPASAFDYSPVVILADEDEDKGFWEKMMETLSLSNLLDKIFSYFEERDAKMDALFINSNFTEIERQQISEYSGGKSPAELTSEFCNTSKTSDAQMMLEDIRRSYSGTEADPKSPVHLIELFERMSSFCP